MKPKTVVLPILLLLMGWATPAARLSAQTSARVPADEAKQEIQKLLDTLEQRKQEMDQLYSGLGPNGFRAADTLRAAFVKQGVSQKATDYYAHDWGGWLSSDYGSGAGDVYGYHESALQDSLASVESEGGADRDKLRYLSDGMKEWAKYEQQFRTWVSLVVDFDARAAKLIGMKMEVDARTCADAACEQAKTAEKAALDEQFTSVDGERAANAAKVRAANRHFFDAISGKRELKITEIEVYSALAVYRNQAPLRQELQATQGQKDALEREFPGQMKKAQAAADRVDRANEKMAGIRDRARDLEAQLTALDNQKPVVPKDALALVHQKESLEKDAARLRALIQENAPNSSALVENLEADEAALERINLLLKDKLPSAPDNSVARKKITDVIASLDGESLAAEKELAHAKSDAEVAAAVLSSLLDRRTALDTKLTELGERLKRMEASVSEVTASADQAPVFDAKNMVKFPALDRVNQELKESAVALEKSSAERDASREEFFRAAEEARQALEDVQRQIWKTMAAKVAVDFAYQMYDVAKAGAKGGPVGALTEASRKIAENLLSLAAESADLSVPVPASEPGSPNEALQQDYGVIRGPGSAGVLGARLGNEAIKRAVKDGGTRLVREYVDKSWMVKIARSELCSNYKEAAELVAAGATGDTIRRRAEEAAKLRLRVDNLQKTGYNFSKLAEGALKDISKTEFKSWIEGAERDAWIRFLEKDAIARAYYPMFAKSSEAYWEAYDHYNDVLKQKADLELGYNPNCGFRIVMTKPFPASALVTAQVKILARWADAVGFQVDLSGSQMSPQGPTAFQIPGSKLESAGNNLKLRVQ